MKCDFFQTKIYTQHLLHSFHHYCVQNLMTIYSCKAFCKMEMVTADNGVCEPHTVDPMVKLWFIHLSHIRITDYRFSFHFYLCAQLNVRKIVLFQMSFNLVSCLLGDVLPDVIFIKRDCHPSLLLFEIQYIDLHILVKGTMPLLFKPCNIRK